MHVVIVGCGRVGSTLGRELTKSGHTVAVIDR
ncbi:MAG: NAD-binding protein, partial [Actinomycetota bacterium]